VDGGRLRQSGSIVLESGPIGSYHAIRGRGLLVAAMLLEAAAYWWQPETHKSMWMVIGSGNQIPWRSAFFKALKYFLSSFIIGKTFIRTEHSLTRSGKI
jgi:hypothetical protein